jgi:hypothetical protein
MREARALSRQVRVQVQRQAHLRTLQRPAAQVRPRKAVSSVLGTLGSGAGLTGGNAGSLGGGGGDTSGGGPSPWELYGLPATKASGEIQAATDKQTKQIQQSYADLIKGNAADTASLNQQAEQGVKQNINAATIELGNYQNLELRAGLILFGITLVRSGGSWRTQVRGRRRKMKESIVQV